MFIVINRTDDPKLAAAAAASQPACPAPTTIRSYFENMLSSFLIVPRETIVYLFFQTLKSFSNI
ncbi:hypothetical protein GCM10008119_24590 [Pedobacter mendelii]|uniref:Uncharacterized protein n=1 Tax=Pedobacter mendelii TaxID=1908240 RepID=A0ABQ2BLA8_9SPHI|nr:hypothetical protein GCM10008119_24590 [Pedobacter mendelii]